MIILRGPSNSPSSPLTRALLFLSIFAMAINLPTASTSTTGNRELAQEMQARHHEMFHHSPRSGSNGGSQSPHNVRRRGGGGSIHHAAQNIPRRSPSMPIPSRRDTGSLSSPLSNGIPEGSILRKRGDDSFASPDDLTANGTDSAPLKISNMCPETVWPGIVSASGLGPGTGGFELPPGHTLGLYVGSTWAGRVWGRTNCSFNAGGTGPSGDAAGATMNMACMTGDCFGILDCEQSGAVPATIVEITLTGGEAGMQTFYDISLVDGYNLPVGVIYMPSRNNSDIPPNLTNAACIATKGYLSSDGGSDNKLGAPGNETVSTDATYPVPLEWATTNSDLGRWCPWQLQAYPPTKPGSGVYPYPDDDVERPVFDPCLSQCAFSGSDADCCKNEYNDPGRCAASGYSRASKKVCPDAYSFAYDDAQSTFMIPKGGGWEIVFCPAGRSTDILRTLGDEMLDVAAQGNASDEVLEVASNLSVILKLNSAGASPVAAVGNGVWDRLVVSVATMVVLSGAVF
ncbi:hypothetical protein MKZ38_006954 [Zalerion maritima]|uniref:Osmotin, thaumatin-like protein n=1 Tax=Zalerion maritima TaxID=339359 RepID=A0AAD5RX65_9PEZI|nr:hypothetical protein MKZ38_006954 [Zalerion maritima]